MKTNKLLKYWFTSTVLWVLIICFASNSQLQAAAVKVEVDKLEVQMLKTPEYEHEGKTKPIPGKAKEWFEIEFEMIVKARDAKQFFLEEIEVKYYILLKAKKYIILSDSITYKNVPIESNYGESLFANAYVSPTSLQALLEDTNPSKNDIVGVTVEIKYRGVLVGGKSNYKERSKWWQAGKFPVLEGHILSKPETPFSLLWWDRCLEVQRKR